MENKKIKQHHVLSRDPAQKHTHTKGTKYMKKKTCTYLSYDIYDVVHSLGKNIKINQQKTGKIDTLKLR